MHVVCAWLALLLLTATQRAGGVSAGATAAREMDAGAPGPAMAIADRCPFTLRVAGQLIPVSQAPEEARYIIVSVGSLSVSRHGVGMAVSGCALAPPLGLLLRPAHRGTHPAALKLQACRTMDQRVQLADLVALAKQNGTAGGEPPLAPLTLTMPLLVGNLSRDDLLWLCQDPQAAVCVDYIERDEQARSRDEGRLGVSSRRVGKGCWHSEQFCHCVRLVRAASQLAGPMLPGPLCRCQSLELCDANCWPLRPGGPQQPAPA